MSEDGKPKREKIPRPRKPPIQPFRDDQSLSIEVSNRHRMFLAQAIMTWSKLEASLHDLIWTIINVGPEDGRILTKHLGAKMLITMARELAVRHIDGDYLNALHRALDLADIRREERDWIAHGQWGTLMPDNVPMASSIKPKDAPEGTVTSETFPDGRMQAIIRDIVIAKDEIFRVRNALAKTRNPDAEEHDPELLHRSLNPKKVASSGEPDR